MVFKDISNVPFSFVRYETNTKKLSPKRRRSQKSWSKFWKEEVAYLQKPQTRQEFANPSAKTVVTPCTSPNFQMERFDMLYRQTPVISSGNDAGMSSSQCEIWWCRGWWLGRGLLCQRLQVTKWCFGTTLVVERSANVGHLLLSISAPLAGWSIVLYADPGSMHNDQHSLIGRQSHARDDQFHATA